jgi:23S rRNA (adenine-N6)-dimethyltransferase
VDDAGIAPGELVVDVGAGRGAVTSVLAERGARVWAVEADPVLVSQLRDRFGSRVRVLETDARRLEWPREPFAVVANLPFAGGNAILAGLLGDAAIPLRRADVILQWEAAVKRAAVWPSTALGVLWGALYELSVSRRLAPTAFAPPPPVDAGILRVVRRDEPLVPADSFVAYRLLVRRAFDARAPIRRLLPARIVKQLANELGFSPSALPRDLDAQQWAAVFRAAGEIDESSDDPELGNREGCLGET